MELVKSEGCSGSFSNILYFCHHSKFIRSIGSEIFIRSRVLNMHGYLDYLSVRSSDAMFHVQESKSKLELFYLLFKRAFLSYFFRP